MSYEQAVGRVNRWRETSGSALNKAWEEIRKPAFAYKTSVDSDGMPEVRAISEEEYFKKPEPPKFDVAAELEKGKDSEYYVSEVKWTCRDKKPGKCALVQYGEKTRGDMVGNILKGLEGNKTYAYTIVRGWKTRLVTLMISCNGHKNWPWINLAQKSVDMYYERIK